MSPGSGAVLPQFIDPQRTLWPQLLVFLPTSVGVDVHGHARRAQNRVFGGVLMAMGASLLMVKRAGN